MSSSRWLCGLLLAAIFLPLDLAAQKGRFERLDDSDWWSTLRNYNSPNFSDPRTNVQHRELAVAHYRILGITLHREDFDAFTAEFGKAEVVERGDASSSRSQICYVSLDGPRPVHLILEKDGEGFGVSFYLFADGAPWKGQNLCLPSPKVSANLTTSSGLRLGLRRPEVRAILGVPSIVTKDGFQYVFEVRKKTSAHDLERLRREYPKMADQDFHDSFDFYYEDADVQARFSRSGLNYLAVSKSETYP